MDMAHFCLIIDLLLVSVGFVCSKKESVGLVFFLVKSSFLFYNC